MRIIQVSINQNKIVIELNKSIIELDSINEIDNLGLSNDTVLKLKNAILRAQEKKLNYFTVKY